LQCIDRCRIWRQKGHNRGAFDSCRSLRSIKISSVRTIGPLAFYEYELLTDVELPCVETMGPSAFFGCVELRLVAIAIPLKDTVFVRSNFILLYTQFYLCENLTTVHLLRGIHNLVSYLLLERWRDEMNQEIIASIWCFQIISVKRLTQ
jgi:hypothetical protein